jgi:hypothetical protein
MVSRLSTARVYLASGVWSAFGRHCADHE